MIITARLRRMILQRSQRGFIEVRYFTGLHAYPALWPCGSHAQPNNRPPNAAQGDPRINVHGATFLGQSL
jgi:hypothetical protein